MWPLNKLSEAEKLNQHQDYKFNNYDSLMLTNPMASTIFRSTRFELLLLFVFTLENSQ